MSDSQRAFRAPPPFPPVEQLANRLLDLAEAIEQRRSDDAIDGILTESQTLCQDAATTGSSETRTLLTKFLQALQTWQRVWGEMGRRSEFRQAVAREASAWANRLGKFKPSPKKG